MRPSIHAGNATLQIMDFKYLGGMLIINLFMRPRAISSIAQQI